MNLLCVSGDSWRCDLGYLSLQILNIPATAISDGAMVLGEFSVPGRPANLDNSRQGPTALDFFFSHLSSLFFLPLSTRQ